MIETLLGGLLGGVFRLAPEVLRWFDRKAERDHELAMQDKALDFEKLPAPNAWNNLVLNPMQRGMWVRSKHSRLL